MALRTFDFKEVAVILGGVQLTGFMDGSALELEFDEQAYNKTVGADGEVSRSKTNNNTGNLTLRLQQTSPSNEILSGFRLADVAGNAGVVPLLIKDANGTTVAFAQHAWVQQWPSQVWGQDIEGREWILDLGQLDPFVGSNNASGGGD